jgi:hypothetical protein
LYLSFPSHSSSKSSEMNGTFCIIVNDELVLVNGKLENLAFKKS